MTVVAKAYDMQFSAKEFIDDETPSIKIGVSNITSKGLYEHPFLDNDAYYIPLDRDAYGYTPNTFVDEMAVPSSITRLVVPIIHENLVFGEQGCWVGTPTENLWPSESWLGNGSVSQRDGVLFEGNTRFELSSTTAATFHTLSPSSSLQVIAGEDYTLSAYYRNIDGQKVKLDKGYLTKTSGALEFNKTLIASSLPDPNPTWKRSWASYHYLESSPAYPYFLYKSTLPTKAALCGMQLEKKRFPSPWCSASRGKGRLAWNIKDTVDLGSDFTISYWKKLYATDEDHELLGIAKDALGNITWGKHANTHEFGFEGEATSLDPADYLRVWNWYVIRKTGNTLTLKVFGNAKKLVDQSIASPPLEDYFYAPESYDLQLGSIRGDNTHNAFFQDVLVWNKSLSDEEIKSKYDTKVKFTSDFNIIAHRFVEDL